MTPSCSIRSLFMSLAIFCGVISSCQRASYSFQPPVSVPPKAAVVPRASTLASTTIAPVPMAVAWPKKISRHRSPLRAARKPVVRLIEQGRIVAPDWQLRPARLPVTSPTLAKTPRQAPAPDPIAAPPSKLVAVVLAVLLGYLGAHLFYLGQRRRAFSYLIGTLLCVALIAVLLAMLPTMGDGFFILFLLVMGVAGIATVYLHALLDAVLIICNSRSMGHPF